MREWIAWRKGTNENSNGLLRVFYPKGRKLSHAGEKTLKKNPTLINARPKKTFGYKIPAFLFEKELQVLRFIWHFSLFSGGRVRLPKGRGKVKRKHKTYVHCRIRFFYDFAVHRKQIPTIIRRSVDEIQHIDKARRGLVVYNYKIIQMVDNLCTMCVLYSRYKFIY